MGLFVQGMAAMACLVIMFFFLRFWRRTADRLFLMFAIAFGLMCATRLIAAGFGMSEARSGYVYTFRFLAYLLIVVAIIDKNRPQAVASS